MNANDLMVAVRVPFRYGVSSGILAGGGSTTVPLTLDGASNFELHEIIGTSNGDAENLNIQNNFSVVIAQTNGQAWSTNPVPQEVFCAQSLTGWRFKLPIILPPRFQMTFAFLDLGAGGTHLVELVGFRLPGS